MCCGKTSMLKVTAFSNDGVFIVNADHIVRIVVPLQDSEEVVDGETVKKQVVVDGSAIVMSDGSVYHVKENMAYFMRAFFDDDSV